MRAVKTKIRSEIRKRLRKAASGDSARLRKQSQMACERLASSPEFDRAKVISLYITSLPTEGSRLIELDTASLFSKAFEQDKAVLVPRVYGDGAEDMDHVYVANQAVLDSFPANKWGIPEPTADQAKALELDAVKAAVAEKDIDFVVLPGVAFDKQCHRLGRGRGYYDSFLRRLKEARGGTPVCTVALSFDEQWVEEVPMETHDQPLDAVFSGNIVIRSAGKDDHDHESGGSGGDFGGDSAAAACSREDKGDAGGARGGVTAQEAGKT